MMWMYGYYFEYYLFLLPALVLVFIAQGMLSSRYKKYGQMLSRRGITGREAAERILRENGLMDVGIAQVAGRLSDHYHPGKKTVFLSDGVFGSTSVAAIGIAAHEVGHALQHAGHYAPLRLRNVMVPVCNIGSNLGIPLCILGAIFSFAPLVNLGLILFSLATIFQLITLPVEFNASKRALAQIEGLGILDGEELKGAKSVLTAAAMTYVAALAQSLMTLLYFISRFRQRD